MPTDEHDITALLQELNSGSDASREQLVNILYPQLKSLAQHYIAAESPDATLQATVLIHEAYLRLLAGNYAGEFQSRTHFFAVAARVMRRILVDRARLMRASHRSSKWIASDAANQEVLALDVLAIDEALQKLEALSPQSAKVVELLYFAGMSTEEAAEVLGISPRTLKREWSFARAWLSSHLRAGT